jgi:hypothetical protein
MHHTCFHIRFCKKNLQTQLFTVLNVGLMAVGGSLIANDNYPQQIVVLFVVCLGGALTCLVWLLLIIRTTRWMQFWHSRLKRIEETDRALLHTFDDEYLKVHQQGPPIYITVGVLITFFAFVWAWAVAYTIWEVMI